MVVAFPDGAGLLPVTYELHELDELTLAYACSIHRAQGSEYPCVVLPLVAQHYLLLQRNLLYTAMTRARKLCVIVGDARALRRAVENDALAARNTALAERLQGPRLGGREIGEMAEQRGGDTLAVAGTLTAQRFYQVGHYQSAFEPCFGFQVTHPQA